MTVSNNIGFLLPTCKGAEYIITAELVRIEAISNYSKLYFSNGKILVVAKVLRWFEEALAFSGFIRTHRTHLINSRFIHTYINGQPGTIKLNNGECLIVAKRKRTMFLKSWHLLSAA
jgi:two-component system, LytTR family, response regulator